MLSGGGDDGGDDGGGGGADGGGGVNGHSGDPTARELAAREAVERAAAAAQRMCERDRARRAAAAAAASADQASADQAAASVGGAPASASAASDCAPASNGHAVTSAAGASAPANPPPLAPLDLDPEHLADLRASGLTTETIALAGLRTERHGIVIARALRRARWERGPALVFPFYVPGNAQPIGDRFKPSNPRTEILDRGKVRKVKYESATRGGVLVYLPPRARLGGWYQDAARTLYWCEGEKKDLLLDQLGFASVGLTGVSCAHDAEYRRRTRRWRLNAVIREHVIIAGRRHVIVFDHDAVSNPQVMAAARRLAAMLYEAGALEVLFVCPPSAEHKGIDDHFVAHGEAATRELLASAAPIEPAAAESDAPQVRRVRRAARAENDSAGGGDVSGDTDAEDGAEPLTDWRLPGGVQPATDLGFACLILQTHGEDLIYSEQLGWLCWDDRRFDADGGMFEALRRAQDTARRLAATGRKLKRDAQRESGVEARKALDREADQLLAWSSKAQSASALKRGLELLQTMVRVRADQLDADPMAFNVRNGTLDLSSGRLREHRRSDRITKLAPVDFEPNAQAPNWIAMLARILPDADVRAFVQRFIGYSLTGSTAEQCLVIFWGGGANGKSTLLEALRNMFGCYGMQTPTDSLMATRGERGPENDLARLRGARFVAATESGESRRLDEERVKRITGGDTIAARFLFKEHFEFRPQFKLALAVNTKPAVRGLDVGIWRRLRLIEFGASIPPNEQDRHLPQKLAGEAPGVLAWALAGCLEWQRAGLLSPAAVTQATKAWRGASDPLAEFLADRCTLLPEARIRTGGLYAAYKTWAVAKERDPITQRAFAASLAARGITPGRSNQLGRHWVGIDLLPT